MEDVFVCCTSFLRMYFHREPAPHNRYRDGARTPAGLLLALCHSRACQQQALRDPRSIFMVGEW